MTSPRIALTAALAVAAATFVLSACASDPTPSSGGSNDASTIEGAWALTEASDADGAFDLTGTTITLTLGDKDSGSAGCNGYGFTMTGGPGAVTIGDIASTLMACEEAIMENETRYLTALGTVDNAELDGVDLVLTGDDVELRYTAATDG